MVQTTNEALAKLDAKVDGTLVAVRGTCVLPSGDVSFYTQKKEHQKWLMDYKHVWSKQVHPNLEATGAPPPTYSVMAHGIPRTFNVASKTELATIASNNGFQAPGLGRVRWMGSGEPTLK